MALADASPDLASCTTSNVVVLVPFQRNEDGMENLERFVSHLQTTLPSNFRVCIVEQSNGSRGFNRGQLLNAAFRACASQGRAPHWPRPAVVVLHDLLFLPEAVTLASYAATSDEDPVRAYSAARHSCSLAGSLGSVIACTPEAFEAANGFPNNFWGHGGENGAFEARLRKAGVSWSQHYGQCLQSEEAEVLQVADASVQNPPIRESALTVRDLKKLLATDKRRWRGDGISTVEFCVESEQVLEQGGVSLGVHLTIRLDAEGVRCGRCQTWRPEVAFSKCQASQRGPAQNSVCKICLEAEYKNVEANVATNADESRRTCTECGQVFATRSQLFKHVPVCGQELEIPACKPCLVAPQRKPRYQPDVTRLQEFWCRLRQAAGGLITEDASALSAGSEAVIRRLIASQALTFQSKTSNVIQLKSLLGCIEGMLAGKDLLVLELGAGKALLTRAVYEILGRRVPVVALDNRVLSDSDPFYDPRDVQDDQAPYTRIVANVQDEEWSTNPAIRQRPTLALTKHLCGGATDASIKRICEDLQLEGVCMAPCCHQKLAYEDYCNRAYLESVGFASHEDFKDLLRLVQLSKHGGLRQGEYQKYAILDMLPFPEIKVLGKLARRLFEEGRAAYLRDRGFETRICRYASEEVTPDNLVLLAWKRA